MTSYEKDIADAIDALEYRLKNRADDTDDRAIAAEFVQKLIGQGWRPTNARPAPAPGSGPGPETYQQGAALARELLDAKLRATGEQPVLRETGAA